MRPTFRALVLLIYGELETKYCPEGLQILDSEGNCLCPNAGNHYRGVDDDQGRVFNNMNQYERANLTLIRGIEKGR